MELLDTDPNHFEHILRFKSSIPIELTAPPTDSLLPNSRKVNEYGEIQATRIEQSQKRLTDEEIDLIIAGYKSGKSTYLLAKEFGCHRTTISFILKRRGVDVTVSKYDRLDAPAIIAMYEDRNTIKVIAEKYNVSTQVITRCLQANNIKIRGRWD